MGSHWNRARGGEKSLPEKEKAGAKTGGIRKRSDVA